MGRSGHEHLERLIGEVSRGERDLGSIRDARLRESVRLALRLHKETPAAPDAYAKARMRARVMAGLEPRHQRLLDNAWTALELVARPAPYIVRAIALASVLVCAGMGAIVASADTLPDDLLYPLKIGSEQVRLVLADAPGDRAAVELSIAQHRLTEAEKLAGNGRTSDALVASAMYSQHIALAASELASRPEADLSAQLESAFRAQRERAQALAATLATDVKSAPGARILAMIASPAMAPGTTKLERVAETAASLAVDLADAADVAAAESARIPTPPPSGIAKRSETPPAVVAQRAAAPRATETQHGASTQSAVVAARATDAARATESARPTTSATPTPPATVNPAQTRDPRAADAAKIARKAADDARAAAEKLKQVQRKNSGKDTHD